jgi:hypothetical protein
MAIEHNTNEPARTELEHARALNVYLQEQLRSLRDTRDERLSLLEQLLMKTMTERDEARVEIEMLRCALRDAREKS